MPKPPSRRSGRDKLRVEARDLPGGPQWEFVQSRCARRRLEDIAEVVARVEAGEIEIARDELVWLLSECPDFLEGHVQLGLIALEEDDPKLARGHFGRAYELCCRVLDAANSPRPLPYSLAGNKPFYEACSTPDGRRRPAKSAAASSPSIPPTRSAFSGSRPGDLMTPASPARFIALDGIDGSGKSSQIGPLVEWLASQGHTVTTCRDPGSTPAGDAVRAILLDRHDLQLAPTAEMFLYMAARAQLVAEVVGPALARGEWVVSDRYLLANIVYQGHAGGLDPDVIRRVGGIATGGLMPDLVLLLDVDLETAARRLDRPLDKLENRGDSYRQRLRNGYLAEAAASPDRILVIDATAARDEVTSRIRAAVTSKFPELG
jgi:dTMP kinase